MEGSSSTDLAVSCFVTTVKKGRVLSLAGRTVIARGTADPVSAPSYAFTWVAAQEINDERDAGKRG